MEEPQKLFRFPGTIEEEEEEKEEDKERRGNRVRRQASIVENPGRAESPLLGQKALGTISSLPSLPRNITLVRVSTQSSSIAGVNRQDSTRSRYRAGPTRKLRRRAVLKNGECNVLQSRISKRSLRFLQDIFTTLVDTQWRWTLLCFSLSFVLSWLGFAVIWWLIAFTHGDLEESHLPNQQAESGWTPCIYNINSFTSCFLFSIETQHTIGYGSRSTTEECPEAIFVMCVQSIAGVMIQAFMVGIVFAKMSRPRQRTQTLLFSRHAVVCQRDGELCLMFRVGDMRKSHIIGATVRAQLIRSRTTKEGECLPQNQQELAVGTDGENGDLFFIWPTTIVHKMNADSPFYCMSAEDMLTERFELVVILEGTIESTGQTTQARSSYLPQEILWGHRFEPMVAYSKERQGYEVDYSLFNSTTQVDTPLCSGKELTEFYRVQDELRHSNGMTIDEEQLQMMGSCPEMHCHGNRRRQTTGSTGQHRLLYTDSTRSYNSLEDGGTLLRNAYREGHSTSSIHRLQMANVQRDNSGQLKIVEIDPDAIQVISETELDQLPEAVNREILRNSREILFEDEHELLREECQSPIGPYGLLTFRRNFPITKNLTYRNVPLLSEEDGRSPNGSKRYLLLALDRETETNRILQAGSRENLVRLRRHTGSKERLDVIRKTVRGVKGSKESPELRSRQGRHYACTFENADKMILETEKMTLSTEPATSISEPPLSPESGFFEGNHPSPSPETGVARNRRSYEHAQLQDVNGSPPRQNGANGSSDSDESANKIISKNRVIPTIATAVKQNQISYTSV